jgi:hypothetical protein
MDQNRKEKIAKMSHLIAGIVILIHGIGHYSTGSHLYPLFVVAGLVFLLIAIFHHTLLHRFPWIDNVFLLIESILSFAVAYEYFELGKRALPLTWCFAGFMQIVSLFIQNRKRSKKHIE